MGVLHLESYICCSISLRRNLGFYRREIRRNVPVRACLKVVYGFTFSRGLMYPSSSAISESSDDSETVSPAACFCDFSRSRAP